MKALALNKNSKAILCARRFSKVAKNGRSSKERSAISKKYQKLDMVEHVLKRPDVYIGPAQKSSEKVWIYNTMKQEMKYKSIKFSPGLYKIFDEILVNAADNKQRDSKTSKISVDIDKKTGQITIKNDGAGIPVQTHDKHKVYIPEMLFGNLLTGENFEDSNERFVGGKNGYGAKLTNIFSKKFEIETVDSAAGLKYKQKWTNNMANKSEPSISETDSKDYTKITFIPDYQRFDSNGLEADTIDLFHKRVFDVAGTTSKSLSVFLNKTKLKTKGFEDYVDLYISAMHKNKAKEGLKLYEKVNDYWEVCVTKSPGTFGQLSFVNAICTYKGGKHVDYITKQATDAIAAELKSKKEFQKVKIPTSAIKSSLFIFVNSLIVNPTFESQSKEALTTSAEKFGNKNHLPKLSKKFIKNILNSSIFEEVKASINNKSAKQLEKTTSSTKSENFSSIEKLEDASLAGKANWKNCTLILTEGDSAKTTAMTGLSKIGRKEYGVYPLRGKFINVREAPKSQISKNAEVIHLCKILGLTIGKKVDTAIFRDGYKGKGLRYGKIMVMTDQDNDGSHIKGLLFNFIDYYWPELLKEVPNFVQVFVTPLIKCFNKDKTKVFSFYNSAEYQRWKHERESKGSRLKYETKYYKGLGSSTKEEAKEYFHNLNKHTILMKSKNYKSVDKALQLAFAKKNIDKRKIWLQDFMEDHGTVASSDAYVDFSEKSLSYEDFVNKELIHFSLADVVRSIPSMVDGLKPSQRKVIFAAFKKLNNGSEKKVASFAGEVMNLTAYHHGETSLQDTIISMARDFVGGSNINYLKPGGQFGSRLAGGKDSAQPRYISTGLTELITKIFRKEDEGILTHLQEEGMIIEPEHYFPIIPAVLVNGANGIGTGWSTKIAMHNPLDLVEWIRNRIALERKKSNDANIEIIPWYKGFKGRILKSSETNNGYVSTGSFELQKDKKRCFLEITELPVNTWTNDYKAKLDKLRLENEDILDFVNESTDEQVKFKVIVSTSLYDKLERSENYLLKTFSLQTNLPGTTNMTLFDNKQRIKQYKSPDDICEDHFQVRKQKYQERKEYHISEQEKELNIITNKRNFVQAVVNNKLQLLKRKKVDIELELERLGYSRLKDSYKYLLEMPILSLSLERIEELQKQVDKLSKDLNEYREKDIFDMWNDELDELVTEYKKA